MPLIMIESKYSIYFKDTLCLYYEIFITASASLLIVLKQNFVINPMSIGIGHKSGRIRLTFGDNAINEFLGLFVAQPNNSYHGRNIPHS